MAYINGKEVLFYPQGVATGADVEIVQERGTSETAAMSQKAITEELKKLETQGAEIVKENGRLSTNQAQMIMAIAKLYEVATSIDLSAYESNGRIVETYEDGSTKTTRVEFDENGNPIKITDGNGNVTVLTW